VDAFNFLFSLYGLILGFTLIEVLSGLVRTIKARHRVRIGWLTPLLAVYVMLDLLSWWSGTWEHRAALVVTYGSLLRGLVTSSAYYFAASFIVPHTLDDGADLDQHYFANRRVVFGTVLTLASLSLAARLIEHRAVGLVQAGTLIIYFGAMILAMISKRKLVNLLVLAVLIGDYLFWALVA
jgi:hypothetical protein